jgi:hypothetical protein
MKDQRTELAELEARLTMLEKPGKFILEGRRK